MNEMKVLRYVSLLFTVAFATSLVAQDPPVFNNAADYDAWKAQFMTPGQPGPTHPSQQPAEDDNSRGGAATCDCWVTPDASYTTINNNTEWNASGWGNGDDGSYGPINLPFGFYLYGQTFTVAYININGSVSFNNYIGTYSSSAFPTTGPTMVAPFWADVDLRGGGVGQNIVQYKVTPTAMYVNWTRVGYYNQQTDKLNSFQVIITNGTDPIVPNGANVSFCYGTMEWTTGSASGGSNGFGGTPATVGANKGDGINYIQFGRFDHAGMDYNGPFGAPSGISWLSDKYFTFSTSVTTGNVPPVVTGQSVCDSLTVCTDQTTQLSVEFLSPEPDQITVPSSYSNTLSNYTVVDSISGLNASITTQFTPSIADTGYHDVYFEGADNGSPPLTSTLHIVVHVLPSPQLVSDSLLVCDNAVPFDMLTVLGGNAPAGGDWIAPDGSSHTNIFIPGEDMDGEYTYEVGIGTSCSATGVATITNVPHAHAGGDTALAYCSWDNPDNLFLKIPDSPQSGGAWMVPGGTVFTGTLDPATAQPGIFQYIVDGTAPCPNDTAFISVAIPQAADAGADSSIVLCMDAAPFSMRTRLGGTPDATGTWTDVVGDAVPDIFDPATGDIGVYTYTVPAVLPCPDQSAVLTINLDPLPRAGTDSSLVICANGGNTPLFPMLGGNPGIGGHWLAPDSSLLDNGILDPSLELSGKYTYVTIGPGACAHRSDTAVVNVHIDPLPVISFTAEPDSGCNPLEVTFTNTTDPIYVGGPCVWDLGDGTDTVHTCGTFTHTYAEAGWYHVKLRVTTPQGCTDQLIAPGAVLVDPAPKATFTYTPDPGIAGNSRLVFTATDPHAVDFHWTFPDGSAPSGKQAAYTFPDKIAGEYLVCLSVADRYGCADTLCDTIPILVANLWVPKAFTPDGNGVNDVFKPIMLDMAPEDYHLWIFDRWGQLLFESTDPNRGWDGSGLHGGHAATGIYVWRLTFRPLYAADKIDHFGTVTLLK
jgi:gliding motility-associated-like protein